MFKFVPLARMISTAENADLPPETLSNPADLRPEKLSTSADLPPEKLSNPADLRPEFKAGRGIGVITLGERHFFFRRFRTVYYLPYERISRYFRRVETVSTRIGCCTGDVNVENVVICVQGRASGREREVAQIEMPGRKAALALMEELSRRAPNALSGRPEKPVPAQSETRT